MGDPEGSGAEPRRPNRHLTFWIGLALGILGLREGAFARNRKR